MKIQKKLGQETEKMLGFGNRKKMYRIFFQLDLQKIESLILNHLMHSSNDTKCQIAKALGYSESSINSKIATLHQKGLIVKDENGGLFVDFEEVIRLLKDKNPDLESPLNDLLKNDSDKKGSMVPSTTIQITQLTNNSKKKMNEVLTINGTDIHLKEIHNEIFLSATDITRPFRKFPNDYLKKKDVRNYNSRLEQLKGFNPVHKKNGVGTWVHHSIVTGLAKWASPDFGLALEEVLKEANFDNIINTPKEPTNLKEYDYNGYNISLLMDTDGIEINATEMAKVFNKQPSDFLRLESTDNFLNTLQAIKHIPRSAMTKTIRGGVNGGTWMCEDVAMEFARWLSPEFALWCNDRIRELLRVGVTTVDDWSAEAMIEDPDKFINAMQALKKERAQKAALEAENKRIAEEKKEVERQNDYHKILLGHQAHQIEYLEKITQSDNLYTASEIAKQLGVNAQTLNKVLHMKGIQFKQGHTWMLYSKYEDKDYTYNPTTVVERSTGEEVITWTKWTEKGRQFIYELLEGLTPSQLREIAGDYYNPKSIKDFNKDKQRDFLKQIIQHPDAFNSDIILYDLDKTHNDLKNITSAIKHLYNADQEITQSAIQVCLVHNLDDITEIKRSTLELELIMLSQINDPKDSIANKVYQLNLTI